MIIARKKQSLLSYLLKLVGKNLISGGLLMQTYMYDTEIDQFN